MCLRGCATKRMCLGSASAEKEIASDAPKCKLYTVSPLLPLVLVLDVQLGLDVRHQLGRSRCPDPSGGVAAANTKMTVFGKTSQLPRRGRSVSETCRHARAHGREQRDIDLCYFGANEEFYFHTSGPSRGGESGNGAGATTPSWTNSGRASCGP